MASGSGCRIVTEPGAVARIPPDINVRVPVLGVTRTADAPGQQALPDPIALDQVRVCRASLLLNSARGAARDAVVHSTRVLAEVLRCGAQQTWPEPEPSTPTTCFGWRPLPSPSPFAPPEAYAQTHIQRKQFVGAL